MPGTMTTPGRLDAYLEAIATGSEDKEAAEFSGLSLQTIASLKRKDPDFAKAYSIARKVRIEVYRSEARRRAVDGWTVPIFYRGEQVGHERKHSDRLLEILLKAEDPDTFGDRKVVEILTTPMTGEDVRRAVQVGQMDGAAEMLEQVARMFSDQRVLESFVAETIDEED